MANKLSQFSIGAIGKNPQIFSYSTADALSTITQTNYILPVLIQNALTVGEGDLFVCSYSSGANGSLLQVQITGTAITLVNIGGTIPPGGDGLTWLYLSGTTQTALANYGFVIGNSALTTITLPATAPIGSVIQVQGSGAGGWKVQAQTGQIINVGAVATTSGGSVQSSNRYDSIQLVNIFANSTWSMAFGTSSDYTIL